LCYVVTDELGGPLPANRRATALRSAVGRAKVPVIRFHGVRHTHATLLLNAGRPPHEVAVRLGHSPQMFMSTNAHVLDQ
jgi:integrase